MTVGTKSVLFGAHQFAIHPWFVAWAWWKLFGFPLDPRLWVMFFVHDLGYWGKPNMDGPEGEYHPFFGANFMSSLFDLREIWNTRVTTGVLPDPLYGKWGMESLLHSRFLAKRLGKDPSRLCYADKLAIILTPSWLYIPMARATGELAEYMEMSAKKESRTEHPEGRKYAHMNVHANDPYVWHQNVKNYLVKWLDANEYGAPDTWTPSQMNGRNG